MPLADELDTFFNRLNQHDASDGVSRQTRTNNQVLTVDEQLVTSIWWRANPCKASGAAGWGAGSSETVRLSWSQSSPDYFSVFWTCSQLVAGVLNNPHPWKKHLQGTLKVHSEDRQINFLLNKNYIKIKSIIGCFEIANPSKNKVSKCTFLDQSYAVTCTVYYTELYCAGPWVDGSSRPACLPPRHCLNLPCSAVACV